MMSKALIAVVTIVALMILDAAPLSAQKTTPDWHMIYFRIEGTQCPVCLARISGYIRNQEAVEMSEISYHLPIESAVIYDKSKLNINKLFDSIAQVEHVTFVDVEDSAIASLPKFIRPRPHKIESLLNPYITP